ncbi:hypothetical protein QUB33_01715 [Microcoleus sp. B3-A4]|uniref:hypothetical protein n=1 Tax=Microcoleus sp. B3-A4 TaxID=2818653 RepID=UPI002FD76E56
MTEHDITYCARSIERTRYCIVGMVRRYEIAAISDNYHSHAPYLKGSSIATQVVLTKISIANQVVLTKISDGNLVG